jgi:hypothetical protein
MSHAEQVRHWNLLNDADQEILAGIRAALSAPTLQNKRNRRVADLTEILDTLKIFQYHTPNDTWKRFLVTGFVQLDDALAINVTQLHKLIYKCKSSINGSLRRMRFSEKVTTVAAYNQLFDVIPALRRNPTELRQWTIRRKTDPQSGPVSGEDDEADDGEGSPDKKDPEPFIFAFEETKHLTLTFHTPLVTVACFASFLILKVGLLKDLDCVRKIAIATQ